MSRPAAKQGDRVLAVDTHLIQPPPPATPLLVPGHIFSGVLDGKLSSDVTIEGKAAATVDSTATNTPPHIPLGGTFVNPPSNKGVIVTGSATVILAMGAGRKAAKAIHEYLAG